MNGTIILVGGTETRTGLEIPKQRCFGKSMVAAYYGSGKDREALFENLAIHWEEPYEKHLNQYGVIKMQEFLTVAYNINEMFAMLSRVF